MVLGHNHGNVLNTAELAPSFGVANTTQQGYLDILSGTFLVRQLQPLFVKVKKRQVKAPKIYFRDRGLLHRLLGVDTLSSLTTHIKRVASREGFALEKVIRLREVRLEELTTKAPVGHSPPLAEKVTVPPLSNSLSNTSLPASA